MAEIKILPFEVEKNIVEFIRNKFEESNLRDIFPNALLREDVLDLLDRYCTVLYYPLEHEENNGFRIKGVPFGNGTIQDFVFINTAQTIEKQIFTAAHELGHIWGVDSFVINNLGMENTPELCEQIVNRFAAVLLMPSENFVSAVRVGLKEFGDKEGNTISCYNLVKMIVNLMNQFFVPMKSVVLRLVELNIFDLSMAETLLGHGSISEKTLIELADKFIMELGFIKLTNRSNKKWIEGLSEKLDIAEKNGLVSKSKIYMMRERFGLSHTTNDMPEMNQLVSLLTQEGIDG